MADREEILKIIRMKGPLLPVQLAKALETSILFASAMLSELVSANILKISTVKIGGSPIYYLPEQRSRLQEFSKHLPQKEKEAYDLLRQKRVLRDLRQEPAIKVALRNMKDYAWPLHVSVNSNKELFWKWYLLSKEEATITIKNLLGIKEKKPEEKVEKAPEPIKKETPKVAEGKEKAVEEQKEKVVEKRVEQKPEEKVLAQHNPEQKPLEQPKKEFPKEKPVENFLWKILGFFTKNNIKVLNKEIIRKNEVDFIIELQTAVGILKYYCKAKSKKKIGDGDLSSAYVQGQLRKLPVLFLSCGEPTKRAKEMLGKEFQNIIFKQI